MASFHFWNMRHFVCYSIANPGGSLDCDPQKSLEYSPNSKSFRAPPPSINKILTTRMYSSPLRPLNSETRKIVFGWPFRNLLSTLWFIRLWFHETFVLLTHAKLYISPHVKVKQLCGKFENNRTISSF